MKTVNYFGYNVEVNGGVEYLAFERVSSKDKSLGYELLGYHYKPYWSKHLKMWVGVCSQKSINISSVELETLGIKPSKSLVQV